MSGSAEKITRRVWLGFEIAARKLGLTYSHYRPTDPLAPISGASRLGTLAASFDPSATLRYTAAPDRDRETRATLVDGARVREGDYLIGPGGTFFIASREPLLPIQSVLCNATVDVLRQVADEDVGDIGYGYDTGTTEGAVLRGWPASLLVRGSSGIGGAGIPGAPTDPSLELLLPRLPNPALVLNTGDVVADDLARRLVVTASERTRHGWRCMVRLVSGG